MDSYPKYEKSPFVDARTQHTKYHGIDIEIKGNHDLSNSPNYKLEIPIEERATSEHKALPAVPNPAKNP